MLRAIDAVFRFVAVLPLETILPMPAKKARIRLMGRTNRQQYSATLIYHSRDGRNIIYLTRQQYLVVICNGDQASIKHPMYCS